MALLSVFGSMLAQHQAPDYCFFVKDTDAVDTLLSYAYPLETYLDQQDVRSIPTVQPCESENCQRGYQAIWMVQNDSLFLVGIQSCNGNMSWCDESVLPNLSTMFAGKCVDGKVFASWVSGELQLFGGAKVPNLKQIVFSYDQYFEVENGEVSKSKRYQNVFPRRRAVAMETNTPELLLFQLQNNLKWKNLPYRNTDPKSFVDINITIKKNGKMTSSARTNLNSSQLNRFDKEINRCFARVRWYQYRRMGKKITVNFVLQTEFDPKAQKIRLLK